MSQTSVPASFFLGISARLSASRRAGRGSAGSRMREEEPRQPPPPAPGGRDCQQVSGALTTQVRPATPAPPPRHPGRPTAIASSEEWGPNEGRGESRDNGERTGALPCSGSFGKSRNTSSNSHNGCFAGRQKIHASALVERSRRIRGQPKNTSPIDARQHPALLPPQMSAYKSKKTLVLDLDETLVHSSLSCKPKLYDLMLEVPLNNSNTTVYVAFRPYLHEFFRAVAPLFEVVIFTASVSIYCNPLMNCIDAEGILGPLRLYRDHCSMVNGAYVKDLSLLGRNLDNVAIVDNSPVTYLFQQRNAIPITSWFDDANDEELLRLIPVLEALAEAPNVYDVLDNYNSILQLQQEQALADN